MVKIGSRSRILRKTLEALEEFPDGLTADELTKLVDYPLGSVRSCLARAMRSGIIEPIEVRGKLKTYKPAHSHLHSVPEQTKHKELIQEFQECCKRVLERLEYISELENSLRFFVEECKKAGPRWGVKRIS
jgi:hypothetical protein